MENIIVKLIENALKNNKDDSNIVSDISSKLNINPIQTKLMIKYIKRFFILSSILDSKYMNYFNEINLLDLREKDEITDENFVKAIVLFIKEKQKNKHFYMVKLETENDIQLNILILSQLDYNSYEYDVKYNQKLNLINNLDIFKYIYNLVDESDFQNLSEELITKKIDSPLIPYLNLYNSNYQEILEYSRKYNNRIRYIDSLGFDVEKLKIILELNQNSLKVYPHGDFKYLIPLPKASVFNLIDLNLEDFNSSNYDFSNIKRAVVGNIENNQENNYINILNKFKNLEEIEFWEINSSTLFQILENIKCKKIKKITGICEDLDEEYNYEKVFQNLPLLECFNIEEHQTMNWTYEITPIFKAERKRISFSLLEQLIRNYLNDSKDRDLRMQFDDDFDQFWEYFETKEDIISRISLLNGVGVFFTLDSYFKGYINDSNQIHDIPKAHYKYFYIECLCDEKILEFVKEYKIEYLFMKQGCNFNLNNLTKDSYDNLKFVFDNSTKTILFRMNGILQSF